MLINHPSIQRVEIIAEALGTIASKVVFIGGSTVPLYIQNEAISDIRPTEDIDCIIEIANRNEYYSLEEKLRKKGFVNDSSLICRWNYKDIIVDIMPIDSNILGFTNKWYKEGINHSIPVKLNSCKIYILTLPYFIASKIEAFYGRNEKDYRFSKGIEDIITILDGLLDFSEFSKSPLKVKRYLKNKFKLFIEDENFLSSVSQHIEQGTTNSGRTLKVIEFMKKF